MFKVLIFIIPILVFSQIIKFAPLPIDTANNLYNKYAPMLEYLSKQTKDEYKFVYAQTYKDLLNNFKNGNIDIVILGALPYLKLKQHFKSALPILTFLNKNKSPYYTCQIITSDLKIKSINDISKNTKIFLTDKLSTCGYLITEYIFHKYNKTLKNYNYTYESNDVNVVYNVTLYDNSIGNIKSNIAKKYINFIKIIDTSIKIPEFSLVVNTNKISPKKIEKIISVLLENREYKQKLIVTPKNFYQPIEKILKLSDDNE